MTEKRLKDGDIAELEAAKDNSDQIQDQIRQQIRPASAQARQASENLNTLKSEVLPKLAKSYILAIRSALAVALTLTPALSLLLLPKIAARKPRELWFVSSLKKMYRAML